MPEPSPVLLEVFERLRCRGVAVDQSIPEECLTRVSELAVRHDLYVLKSHTELALSVAGTLASLGALLLNPYRACSVTQDKITCAKLLHDAGVPVPPSWVTVDPTFLMALLANGPLIAKPYRGHWGRGIYILKKPDDIGRLSSDAGPYIVQRYLVSEEDELKTYVVGQQVFGMVKTFSATSFQDAGRPVDIDSRTHEIVLACGAALGLHLYGVDLVRTDAGPFVVDVNYFPGYKGAPGAADALADYIYDYAAGGKG